MKTFLLPALFLAGLLTSLITTTNVAYANEMTKQQALELLVFKSPTCGCCGKWIDHLKEQGVVTHSQNSDAMGEIKTKFGVQPNYRSCHTAITREGFVFEGHVPAKYIVEFLAEKPEGAIGLSVPAMPVGSPGMEVGDKFMPYQVLLLLADGSSKVFADIKSYQQQF